MMTVSCDEKEDVVVTPPPVVEEIVISNEVPSGVNVPEGMVYIPEVSYTRGNERELGTRARYPEEAPEHKVTVSAFLIDETEVTNAQFLKFVEATGYLTQAEKGLTKKDFPHAPADQLQAGASVFTPPAEQPELWEEGAVFQWWEFTAGANWRHPSGPDSSIEDKMDHPVTCVTNEDAQAYAKWAGKRLPTEAEWEAAARGGLERKLFTWGDSPRVDDAWMGNTFQGTFPTKDTQLDGYGNTAPVRSFPPNAYGLYDMAGNVWEHVSDFYRPDAYKEYAEEEAVNPNGPLFSIDYNMHQEIEKNGKVPEGMFPFHRLGVLYTTKGGSFLCHHSYCLRYRPAARHYSEGLTPTNHTGFRCAQSL